MVMRALGLWNFIQAHRSVVHVALHFQHLAESGLEHGQHPLHFLLAKLTQNLLQLGLGLLQFLDGLFLIFYGPFMLGFFQFFPGLVHAFLRGLEPFAGGIALLILAGLLRSLCLRLIFTLLAFTLLLLLALVFIVRGFPSPLSAFPSPPSAFLLSLSVFFSPPSRFLFSVFGFAALAFRLLTIAFFVSLNILGQAAGFFGDFSLLAGKQFRIVAVGGPGLHVLLLF